MKIVAHVLDSTYGQSIAGLHAYLERASGDGWVRLCDTETNSEGCIEDWDDGQLERGLYRIVFDNERYFAALGAITVYPEVVIIFRMPSESRTCLVQVALSPYSYSTYFGVTEAIRKAGERYPWRKRTTP
jgi:5-hydroxyisourate hydrolase